MKFTSTVAENLTVVFGPEIWGQQTQGGISRYFSELICGLHSKGVKVHTLVAPNSNAYLTLLPEETIVYLESERIEVLKDSFRKINLENSAEIIFHPTYFEEKNVRLAKSLNFTVVVTVFDLIADLFQKKSLKNLFSTNSRSRICISADRVLAISVNTKRDIEKIYKIPCDKIGVTLLGTSLPNSEKPTELKRIPLEPYLLYVGKRDGYKNFEIVIHALAEFTGNKELGVIAFGGGEFTHSEIEMISQLELSHRIIQVDGSDHDLRNAYSNALALVYPSLYEGFGLPPIEAMQNLCPVIASSAGSIPEICGRFALYFEPTDLSMLKNHISLLLEGNYTINLGDAKKWADDYSWDKTVDATIAEYKIAMEIRHEK